MKHILGLDLGNSSIGWAHVTVDEKDSANNSIIDSGVRIVPLTTEEATSFPKGKAKTLNGDRTLKRGMRRNNFRYKLRRDGLIRALRDGGVIDASTPLAEDGKGTTHETLRLRARAVRGQITLGELARVLLSINKKRGYKSNRKLDGQDEGALVDGLSYSVEMKKRGITPGELALEILAAGKKHIPDCYRSDLEDEFRKIWNKQREFYPDLLTNELSERLMGRSSKATYAILSPLFRVDVQKLSLTKEEKKRRPYELRSKALRERLEPSALIEALQSLNGSLSGANNYLGNISDRSKQLYFEHLTVGEYMYRLLRDNPHASLRNVVFFRRDYLEEFNRIWNTQAAFYPEVLTDTLKKEVRDYLIFYQRKLRSQKHLISFCEFEQKQKDGRTVGLRVAPKSSPIYQETKILQNLNNLQCKLKEGNKISERMPNLFDEGEETPAVRYAPGTFDEETKAFLFEELNMRGDLTEKEVLTLLFPDHKEASAYRLNYKKVEGNRTNYALYNAYLRIIQEEGYDLGLVLNGRASSTVEMPDIKTAKLSASEVKQNLREIFGELGIRVEILDFDATLPNPKYAGQLSFRLWHLLYSYVSDESDSGNETLYKNLSRTFGFKRRHAEILASVSFSDDYGSLSTKALRKIYPYLRVGLGYSEACAEAGYNHSGFITKEENETRVLKDTIDVLPKNSLRQPVVEKILNQMIHVVNGLMDRNSSPEKRFHFDEIHIELARELKQSAAERETASKSIAEATRLNETLAEVLKKEFGISRPTRNDVIRYKLWLELAPIGYKDIYTGEFIPRDIIFSQKVDVDHIIPQSVVFNDSFSNKVLTFKDFNIRKGAATAFDYISTLGAEKLAEYRERIEILKKEGAISEAKVRNLLKKKEDLSDGFIDRDLRASQYISRKAMELLHEVSRDVLPTSGRITDRLRRDWGLIGVLKELDMPKFRAVGQTETNRLKDGQEIEEIKDWTKRNDNRHHAMDAITIAFTRRNHVQYLNHMNAKPDSEFHPVVIATKRDWMEKDADGNRVFKKPFEGIRSQVKKSLSSLLVSYKANSKVVTPRKNKLRGKKGHIQATLTPRGQLHKETIYGLRYVPKSTPTKLSKKFTHEDALLIVSEPVRKIVLDRIDRYGGEPAKAFDPKAMKKDPVLYHDAPLLEVTLFDKVYTIRKEVTDLTAKDIPNVLDKCIREALSRRLKAFGGKEKEAFSGLEDNPIWVDREARIPVKRVTLISDIKDALPLHSATNHLGDPIYDGDEVRVKDYVQTRNNHHVALFLDEAGKVREVIVTFFDAVNRAMAKEPVIRKHLPDHPDWQFLFSLKSNEYFVFKNESTGFDPFAINLLDPANRRAVSPNLYRVQKLSSKDYVFRHHLESTLTMDISDLTFKRINMLSKMLDAVKVRLDHLGNIVAVGEY